jgi:exodeoxyribonuclease-5
MTEPIPLNAAQLKALDLILDWHRGACLDRRKLFFHLAGFAGTGKTTIMQRAIKQLGLNTSNVALCAYTAKASKVLEKRAGLGEGTGRTIHSLIYYYRTDKQLQELRERIKKLDANDPTRAWLIEVLKDLQDSSKEFILKPREELAHLSLIVADECSMIGERMYNDLLRFKIPILLVGDSGQLPPIKNREKSVCDLVRKDFELVEIVRNDDEIVKYANAVRTGEALPFIPFGNKFARIQRDSVTKEMMNSADVVLCFKNATRRNINREFRRIRSLTTVLPQKDEVVVCRQNNAVKGVFRGMTYTLLEDARPIDDETIDLVLLDDNKNEYEIEADCSMFKAYADEKLAKEIDDNVYTFKRWTPPFDFGYAMTVHSSQGSEWDKVVVWNDYLSFKRDTKEYDSWLYTAITRAAAQVTIVEAP